LSKMSLKIFELGRLFNILGRTLDNSAGLWISRYTVMTLLPLTETSNGPFSIPSAILLPLTGKHHGEMSLRKAVSVLLSLSVLRKSTTQSSFQSGGARHWRRLAAPAQLRLSSFP
jgi:hypothetical protein